MMHYYFLTSLKPILMNQPLPMSAKEFLKRAQECLSGPVLSDLSILSQYQLVNDALRLKLRGGTDLNFGFYWQKIKSSATSKFLRTVADDAINLYGNIALKMAAISNLATTNILDIDHNFGKYHENRIKSALNHQDPIERERGIVCCFISFLEEKANHEVFSKDQIFIYYIKLLLWERLASFDEIRGQAILDDLKKKIIEGARHE